MPKKLVPNPDFETAIYKLDYIWQGEPPDWLKGVPEIRTNNPNYVSDGMKESDKVPSHIEVEVPCP